MAAACVAVAREGLTAHVERVCHIVRHTGHSVCTTQPPPPGVHEPSGRMSGATHRNLSNHGAACSVGPNYPAALVGSQPAGARSGPSWRQQLSAGARCSGTAAARKSCAVLRSFCASERQQLRASKLPPVQWLSRRSGCVDCPASSPAASKHAASSAPPPLCSKDRRSPQLCIAM